jgi:hypothetical protein
MDEKKTTLRERLDIDRILGALAMIGGLAAIYYYIIRQAIAATNHDPRVFVSFKGVTISPVVLAAGVVYMVYGSRVPESLGDSTKRPTTTTWVLIAVFCISDLILYWWLKRFIESYGYVFSYRPA